MNQSTSEPDPRLVQRIDQLENEVTKLALLFERIITLLEKT